MSFQVEPLNTKESGFGNFASRIAQDSGHKSPSPLNKRRMNLGKLDLKHCSSHELSRELNPASSSDNKNETSADAIKTEEAKSNFLPLSAKSPEKALTEKNIDQTMNLEHRSEPQEFLFRNQEDGSQSPFPGKRLSMPPLEFSLMPENDALRVMKRESNQTHEDCGSPTSVASAKMNSLTKGMMRFQNDYEIIELVGKGSFGKVFRCVNKLDKKEYAVKETFRKFIGRYKAYGLNEIQSLASLGVLEDNVDVVRYYHCWVEDEKLFIVMEYCPSSLAKQRIQQNGHFPEAQLKKIARDVCLALSYLHRNDLVHLDVKTENILISKTNRYKLGDMGQTQKLSQSSTDLDEGDCRYQAPEFMNSDIPKRERDYKKVDIFSLGITLFELATNHDLPKNGAEWQQLRNEEFYRLRQVTHLSRNFKNLIEWMLKKDPSQRPAAQELLNTYLQSEEELNTKWENIVGDLLESEKKDLETKREENNKRRKSIS